MKLQIALAATPILYHITNIRAAAFIAQKNRFELKPADGTEVEEALQGKASYYLSTARHRTASYTKQSLGTNSVIFTLSGTALATKYKIKAVDYWSGVYNFEGKELHNRDRMESEDRVLSPDPYIENIQRYVTEIHAFRGTGANDMDFKKKEKLITLYKFALRHKIPIYFYDDKKALFILDKRKAVPLDAANLADMGESYGFGKMTEYEYKYRRGNNEVVGWLQLYEMPAPADLEDWRAVKAMAERTDRSKMAYAHLRYHHSGDPVRQLNNGMHNEKTTPYEHSSRGREDLDRLIKILRKNKWNVKQFTDFLHKKWFGERK